MLLDIESLVDNLRGIRADLESYIGQLEGPRHDTRRYTVGLILDQLGQRVVTLESTARHHGSTDIEVTRLTAEERHAVERAVMLLDRELVLEPDPAGPKTWSRLRAVLAAADDVLLAAARGFATHDATTGTAPQRGPGLVLALSRAKH